VHHHYHGSGPVINVSGNGNNNINTGKNQHVGNGDQTVISDNTNSGGSQYNAGRDNNINTGPTPTPAPEPFAAPASPAPPTSRYIDPATLQPQQSRPSPISVRIALLEPTHPIDLLGPTSVRHDLPENAGDDAVLNRGGKGIVFTTPAPAQNTAEPASAFAHLALPPQREDLKRLGRGAPTAASEEAGPQKLLGRGALVTPTSENPDMVYPGPIVTPSPKSPGKLLGLWQNDAPRHIATLPGKVREAFASAMKGKPPRKPPAPETARTTDQSTPPTSSGP
jgi:hypothetical protein